MVSLGCFLLMLKHLGVLNVNKNVTKKEILLMFKRASANYKELDFDQFRDLLEKVGIAMYKDELLTDERKIDKFYLLIKID